MLGEGSVEDYSRMIAARNRAGTVPLDIIRSSTVDVPAAHGGAFRWLGVLDLERRGKQ
jgi:hypothetical protein